MKSHPAVYIVLINFNSGRDTTDCIGSLLGIHYENYRIVLIDNASIDDSLTHITSWLQGRAVPYREVNDSSAVLIDRTVTLITSDINLGFGGACNIGLKLASCNDIPFVLLLNNDTIVEPEFLTELVGTMGSGGDSVGAVGGKIYHGDDSKRIWYCGGHIDFIAGMAYHSSDCLSRVFETEFITGCLMLLRVSVLRKTGSFDEDYFLNVEDWDLSHRLRASGYRLFVNPKAVIQHKISGSIGGTRTFLNQYYFHRNRLYFLTFHSRGMRRFFIAAVQFFILPAWSLIQLMSGNTVGLRALTRAIRDFLGGVRGPYID